MLVNLLIDVEHCNANKKTVRFNDENLDAPSPVMTRTTKPTGSILKLMPILKFNIENMNEYIKKGENNLSFKFLPAQIKTQLLLRVTEKCMYINKCVSQNYGFNSYKSIKCVSFYKLCVIYLHITKPKFFEEIDMDSYLENFQIPELFLFFELESLNAYRIIENIKNIFEVKLNRSKKGNTHICGLIFNAIIENNYFITYEELLSRYANLTKMLTS